MIPSKSPFQKLDPKTILSEPYEGKEKVKTDIIMMLDQTNCEPKNLQYNAMKIPEMNASLAIAIYCDTRVN